jgi:Tfp pilus assembly protein PilO
MKQGISPAAAIVAILLVVVIIAAVGYFVFLKPKSGGKESPEDIRAMQERGEQMRQEAERAGRARSAPQGPSRTMPPR